MSSEAQSRVLSGWGNSTPSTSRVLLTTSSGAVAGLSHADDRGVIARGLGRSYGDAAQNGGGLVLEFRDRIDGVVLDEGTGVVRSPAGVSFDDLLRFLVPRGFFVPVTPGTRFVTVGGAVASDIHGKNHHIDGSFGSHVLAMKMLLSDGSTVHVTPEQESELFWATIGGMGLTGAILEVTFAALPIETSRCSVDTERIPHLEDLLERMQEDDDEFKYSVAWTDLLATGRNLGRSVLWRGDHARRSDMDVDDQNCLAYDPKVLLGVPPFIPSPGVVNRLSTRIFNEVWYRRAPLKRCKEIKSISSFFHPLDAISHWNRLYGPRGFVQYQFVVPFEATEILKQIVANLVESRLASPLVVLKRFGAANAAPLSFPCPGWTLTVDMPARVPGLAETITRLDALVLDSGGRHYLSKDALLGPEAISRGYPRLGEWLETKSKFDPSGKWTSDLSRRLLLAK